MSGTAYCIYPILPFGIVAYTFFPTTFLEIAVYPYEPPLISYDLFKLKIVQKKKTTVTLHPFFLLSGKYWLDPNGGCSEDAFQAECKFTKEGQTCVYPKQQQVDYMIQFSLHFGLACLE